MLQQSWRFLEAIAAHMYSTSLYFTFNQICNKTKDLFYVILFYCMSGSMWNKYCNLFYCRIYFILLHIKPLTAT